MNFAENLVQFYPNRITVTAPRERSQQHTTDRQISKWLYKWGKNLADLHGIDFVPANKIERQDFADWKARFQNIYNPKEKTSVNLSDSSKRAIRDSIFSMYQLSPPRTIKVGSGKFIYNFRQSFVTLTLPSMQIHSDVELKKCLNHFLTNIRRAFKIQNYVWKAELQKNENIHFHLSFDKYIPFQAVRYYWLLAIKPLGYVDAYAAKFSPMSLAQYAEYRNLPLHEAHRPYEMGRRSNWQSPNCVDVSAVTTASSVSNYLSKYFAKNEETDLNPERIAAFGKVWARSQSLSRLKYKNKFLWHEMKAFVQWLVESKAVKEVNYDYSTVYYFNFKELKGRALAWINELLNRNASAYRYPIPI